jgi:hypothetical protein
MFAHAQYRAECTIAVKKDLNSNQIGNLLAFHEILTPPISITPGSTPGLEYVEVVSVLIPDNVYGTFDLAATFEILKDSNGQYLEGSVDIVVIWTDKQGRYAMSESSEKIEGEYMRSLSTWDNGNGPLYEETFMSTFGFALNRPDSDSPQAEVSCLLFEN